MRNWVIVAMFAALMSLVVSTQGWTEGGPRSDESSRPPVELMVR